MNNKPNVNQLKNYLSLTIDFFNYLPKNKINDSNSDLGKLLSLIKNCIL